MSSDWSRRQVLQLLGAAGAGSVLPPIDLPGSDRPVGGDPILSLSSTTEVFVPPRGRAFQKFSFDFPEPSVEFAGLRFAFLVFTRENAYALDPGRMTAEAGDHGVTVTATGLTWAGGQESAAGRVTARIRRNGEFIEWDVTAEMDQPIKAVTAVVRGVPRGKISAGGNQPFDPGDDEVLLGYPFGAGDLFGGNSAGSVGTPFAAVEKPDGSVFFFSSLDARVRAKRLYFQPGETTYRVEAVFEAEGWLEQTRVDVPVWRIGPAASRDEAVALHYRHLEQAYHLPTWESRTDVPAWLRDTALVLALHGMHYTGYVFNDFVRMGEILRWTAARIPANRVLVFLPAWDGRYYWDYPGYTAAPRLGGEDGFRRLIREGQALAFRFMPMFGANAANRGQPGFPGVADAVTQRIDGDRFDLTWVDWDNDRHQEGWLSYMNLGVDSWRNWLAGRIGDVIDRYGVDGYFLDISGGWMNNTRADMHEGIRRLVDGPPREVPGRAGLRRVPL